MMPFNIVSALKKVVVKIGVEILLLGGKSLNSF